MQYIRVIWVAAPPGEPYELWSELDGESWELRKVELFRDGRKGYANSAEDTGSTRLGLIPVPPLDQINADPEFSGFPTTKDEFEQVWNDARQLVQMP